MDWIVSFTTVAYNLIRLRTLLARPARSYFFISRLATTTKLSSALDATPLSDATAEVNPCRANYRVAGNERN